VTEIQPGVLTAVALGDGVLQAACALSFMSERHEAGWVREVAPSCPIIGKVERREAMEHLNEVDASGDHLIEAFSR
jgi:hypothetical protein